MSDRLESDKKLSQKVGFGRAFLPSQAPGSAGTPSQDGGPKINSKAGDSPGGIAETAKLDRARRARRGGDRGARAGRVRGSAVGDELVRKSAAGEPDPEPEHGRGG